MSRTEEVSKGEKEVEIKRSHQYRRSLKCPVYLMPVLMASRSPLCSLECLLLLLLYSPYLLVKREEKRRRRSRRYDDDLKLQENRLLLQWAKPRAITEREKKKKGLTAATTLFFLVKKATSCRHTKCVERLHVIKWTDVSFLYIHFQKRGRKWNK